MGKYDFAAQRVAKRVSSLIAHKRITNHPPWLDSVKLFPPSERLVRPALQSGKKRQRASRMFQPVKIRYPEDELRAEFFGDHPWELARPRIVLEDDGKDYQKQDWSRIEAAGRQLNGERYYKIPQDIKLEVLLTIITKRNTATGLVDGK